MTLRVKTNSFSFDKLEEDNSQYINDPQYVHKKCGDRTIVILQKLEKTITNEDRKPVCYPENAIF